jgi:DNA repair protein RadC
LYSLITDETNTISMGIQSFMLTSEIVASLQDIADLRQEHFICFSLDSKNRVINQRTVFIGTLTSVIAHPREIFAGALTDGAAGIIVAHNHPSGDVWPSKGDISTNQQLIAAGQILGVPVEDHIIVGGSKHFSFCEHGLMGTGDINKFRGVIE